MRTRSFYFSRLLIGQAPGKVPTNQLRRSWFVPVTWRRTEDERERRCGNKYKNNVNKWCFFIFLNFELVDIFEKMILALCLRRAVWHEPLRSALRSHRGYSEVIMIIHSVFLSSPPPHKFFTSAFEVSVVTILNLTVPFCTY